MKETMYCPNCDAQRTPAQQDQHGHCVVCGAVLQEKPGPGEEGSPGEESRATTVAFPSPTARVPAQEEEPGRRQPEGRDEAVGEPQGEPPAPDRTGRQPQPTVPTTPQADRETREEGGTEGAGGPQTAATSTAETSRAGTSRAGTSSAGISSTTPPPPPPPAETRRVPSDETRSTGPSPGREDGHATVAPRDLEETQRVPMAEPEEEVPLESGDVDYDQLVAEVEANVQDGFDLFGLVGGSASGKTHALKALTYLLQTEGTRSDRASFKFMRAPTPAPTGEFVFHYDYQGAGRRWTFVDAGGELYNRLRQNRWDLLHLSTRLSRWLFNAHGLFCFLHLRPGHFGGSVLDEDPTLEEDEDRRRVLEKQQERARAAQQELAFFRNFFLFLRAVRAEQGDIATVIEHCRSRAGQSLEEALQTYSASAPLLDVPVMFFFTQADAYDRKDFAVGQGVYLKPRDLAIPTSVFAARYLPTLFDGVASQVRRFKFDFLQSYEEADVGKKDERGDPVVKTYWHAPDDPRQHLSVGLLSGLEFVLRNQPRERRFWELPEITTRQALILHRLLHRKPWQGVPQGLLGSWRQPASRRTDGRPTTAAPETP